MSEVCVCVVCVCVVGVCVCVWVCVWVGVSVCVCVCVNIEDYGVCLTLLSMKLIVKVSQWSVYYSFLCIYVHCILYYIWTHSFP